VTQMGLPQLASMILKRSKLPKAFLIAAFLEAVVPSYWNSYLKQSKMESVLNLLNIRPCERIVDVGANVGLFAVEAADKVGPDGLVIAIEPEPGNLLALRIRARGISNIIPIAAAIWNRPTTIDLHRSSNSLWHSVKPKKRTKVKEEFKLDTIKVPCTTVDRIAKTFLNGHIDVMKISVEGSEVEALGGAHDTIPQCRGIAIQCVATPEELEESIDGVVRLLDNYGFRHIVLPLGATWAWVVFLRSNNGTRSGG